MKYQEKYILRGTEDRYCTIEDMLEEYRSEEKYIQEMLDAKEISLEGAEVLRQFNKILKENLIEGTFTKEQAAHTKRLEKMLKDRSPYVEEERQKILTDIIYRDPRWIKIRETAKECLEKMGMNLAEWEKIQGCV